MTDNILEVKDLDVSFHTREGVARVLSGVNLELKRGSTLGLVGESGCGKSVLCSAILNLVRRPGRIEGGDVLYRGESLLAKPESELRTVRGKEIALILPHPHTALNPLLTVGDQIANMYRSHSGASKAEAETKAVDAIARVGINDPEYRYRAYPHELSGGMAQRIIIAMALLCSPRVLLADEPTSGVDVTISAQVLDMMAGLIEQGDSSNLIATRDLAIVAQYCQSVCVMCAGQIVEQCAVASFFTSARHPYSRLLLAAISGAGDEDQYSVSRKPPDKYNLPAGCPFSTRCRFVEERCATERPPIAWITDDHYVRCFCPVEGAP
jgi:oligopeptide/dipeptide ABC transporter ATP-binding protein